MNRVYLMMVQRLPLADKEHPDPRGDFDRELEVADWETPTTKRYRVADRPSDAPSWWRGDEEATDAFMHGMGVQTLEQLRR